MTIIDDGPGFAPEIMDRIGEPYVTSRRHLRHSVDGEAGGLGLGLFIAKTLLERSGAKLDVRESGVSGARRRRCGCAGGAPTSSERGLACKRAGPSGPVSARAGRPKPDSPRRSPRVYVNGVVSCVERNIYAEGVCGRIDRRRAIFRLRNGGEAKCGGDDGHAEVAAGNSGRPHAADRRGRQVVPAAARARHGGPRLHGHDGRIGRRGLGPGWRRARRPSRSSTCGSATATAST